MHRYIHCVPQKGWHFILDHNYRFLTNFNAFCNSGFSATKLLLWCAVVSSMEQCLGLTGHHTTTAPGSNELWPFSLSPARLRCLPYAAASRFILLLVPLVLFDSWTDRRMIMDYFSRTFCCSWSSLTEPLTGPDSDMWRSLPWNTKKKRQQSTFCKKRHLSIIRETRIFPKNFQSVLWKSQTGGERIGDSNTSGLDFKVSEKWSEY